MRQIKNKKTIEWGKLFIEIDYLFMISRSLAL